MGRRKKFDKGEAHRRIQELQQLQINLRKILNTTDTYELRRKFEKIHGRYPRWETRRALNDRFYKLISDADKEIKKLKKAALDDKAKRMKKKLGKTVADLILARSQDSPGDYRYASPGGREVYPLLQMFKKTGDKGRVSWYNRYKEEHPETFAQMAVLKLTGHKFSGHHIKDSALKEHRFRGVVSYQKRWAVQDGQRPDADTEKRDHAQKIIDLMKDTVWCVYMDTGRSVGLKPKDLFILEDTKPRRNKKHYRLKQLQARINKHNSVARRLKMYANFDETPELIDRMKRMSRWLKENEGERALRNSGLSYAGVRKVTLKKAFLQRDYSWQTGKTTYTWTNKLKELLERGDISSLGFTTPNIRPH